MNDLVNQYKQKGDFYLTILEVRAISSQTRAALPSSRDLALSRLETVQKEIKEWDNKEGTFYDLVATRAKEIAGQYGKKEKAVEFEKLATDSKGSAGKIQSDLNVQLVESIQKLKVQAASTQEPLIIVVEVDEQGRVNKASKMANG